MKIAKAVDVKCSHHKEMIKRYVNFLELIRYTMIISYNILSIYKIPSIYYKYTFFNFSVLP